MQLTNAEEQLMKLIWKLNKAYMKNILDEYSEPKPAATTVATLLKRMTHKGFIGFNQHGSNREYFARIKKTEYFAQNINLLIKDFFNNSASQFASFFTNETNLSLSELEELKRIVEKKIENSTRKK